MNNNEFLDKLNGYLAQINERAEKANALAEEYKHSEQVEVVGHEQYTLELLKDYVDSFSYAKDIDHPTDMYWVDNTETIGHGYVDDASVLLFENFARKDYAEKLRKMNRLNGMMLAFKWCYDRDYEFNWADDDSPKYTIVWNMDTKRFDYMWTTISRCNHVYFSSDDIAKKCVEWLNKIAESEDLI